MYTIAGVFCKGTSGLAHNMLAEAIDSIDYWNRSNSDYWNDENMAACTYISKGWYNRITYRPLIHDNFSNCSIVSNARLDYKDELYKNLEESCLLNISDGELILKAYLKFGDDCLNYLFGDFVFVIWDGNRNQLLCARDHFGCRPFYYYEDSSYFIFSTDIRVLLAFSEIETSIREKAIVDSVLQLQTVKHTAYESIVKLSPAHRLIVSKSEFSVAERYWEIAHQSEFLEIDETHAILELKEKFVAAVRERIKDCRDVAIELSGGLDSSAIAAVVCNSSKDKEIDIHTFTHALDDNARSSFFPFYDQRKEVKLLSEKYKFSSENYITGIENWGIINSISESLRIFMRPPVQSVASFSLQLYDKVRLCNQHVLLSGFGGDEGVTIQASGLLKELARKKKWTDFIEASEIKTENGAKHSKLFFLKHMLLAWAPEFKNFIRKFGLGYDVWRKRYNIFPVLKNYKVQHQTRRRYFANIRRFLRFKGGDVKEYIHFRLHLEGIENRLEESYLITQTNEIEYRYPFLDVKLLEYFYSLPSTFMYKNGIGRYAFRSAIKDILPSEIVWGRRKNDSTIPYFQYLLDREETEILEIIKDAMDNNSFHYIDYKKLLSILKLLKGRNEGRESFIGPRVLFNSLSVLILQKWQREQKIDIGIKF